MAKNNRINWGFHLLEHSNLQTPIKFFAVNLLETGKLKILEYNLFFLLYLNFKLGFYLMKPYFGIEQRKIMEVLLIQIKT